MTGWELEQVAPGMCQFSWYVFQGADEAVKINCDKQAVKTMHHDSTYPELDADLEVCKSCAKIVEVSNVVEKRLREGGF